ncbi:MAG: flagellar basal body P-ring protein FlgI [Candidatus Tectomicrobia bacterium]|nr:flagellar basal body P-ring protein FlgI [Candidatus Tectomicrobia bacterium]
MRKPMTRRSLLLAALLAGMLLAPGEAGAVRLKDVASVAGVRSNQLLGYGLVVGLDGTGDGDASSFTAQSLANLFKKLGINVLATAFKVKNVAAVMVTADFPPFGRSGSKLDVTVSAVGDSKSLLGGTLLLTPLRGADGEVYAVAQGSVSLGGGFAFEGATGTAVKRNHPTVGVITGGATVEREIPVNFAVQRQIRLALHQPDFTTAARVVSAINQTFGDGAATARDSGTVDVDLGRVAGGAVNAMAQLERIEVTTDQRARVVINERTGTIVMGENVRISTVAISHGNLNIVIREESLVSQPGAFAPEGAATVVVPRTDVTVKQEKRNMVVIPKTVSIGDVVRGLNAIGVAPRDLIAILQALKAAGALDAEITLL